MPGVNILLIIVNAGANNALKLLKIPDRPATSWRWHGETVAIRRQSAQRSVNRRRAVLARETTAVDNLDRSAVQFLKVRGLR